ncbi:Fpg/Nei family DNA glycosylase [Neomicrococcus lactis]|uniref:DNA-(apurinic or apyrimidinic site) lyase n=1 Tax=Neomicrococcus lactis TaxID=732241 RepID=A0A7W8YBL5_9MICC|nr:endonuclease-8 [Neomicrococcus lactis]
MPEGDTVFRTAAKLRAALEHQTLTGSDFRVPKFATVDLSGRECTSVESRGKHLFIVCEDLAIHSHLMMEGHWDVYRPGERWRSPAFKARCILSVATAQAVGFELGFVRLVPTASMYDDVAHLGPDPLGPSWDRDEVLRRMRLWPETKIGLVVLDQSVLAGVGNIYRCESLFMARVNPHSLVSELSDEVLLGLIDMMHRLLNLNRERGRRITTGAVGREPYWVYGRRGKPCQRCGAPVVYERLGDPQLLRGRVGGSKDGDSVSTESVERDLFYCQYCQRA